MLFSSSFPTFWPTGNPANQGSAYPGASAIPGAPEVSSFAGGSARSWDLYNDLLRDFFCVSTFTDGDDSMFCG